MKLHSLAAAAVLILTTPAFAQMSGPGGMAAGTTQAKPAMAPGMAMSGNAMASGAAKKKKAGTAMSGSMSGPAATGSMSAGASGSMSGPSH